jgi:hypothetical protein
MHAIMSLIKPCLILPCLALPCLAFIGKTSLIIRCADNVFNVDLHAEIDRKDQTFDIDGTKVRLLFVCIVAWPTQLSFLWRWPVVVLLAVLVLYCCGCFQ